MCSDIVCMATVHMMMHVLSGDPTGNSYVQALDELDQGWGVLGSEDTANTAARDHDSYVQHGMQKPTDAGEDPRLVRSYFER